jgi:hypothetical protein
MARQADAWTAGAATALKNALANRQAAESQLK